jgi:hypothetical protein
VTRAGASRTESLEGGCRHRAGASAATQWTVAVKRTGGCQNADGAASQPSAAIHQEHLTFAVSRRTAHRPPA